MIGRQRQGVFISYARADGEEFAASLRESLRQNAPDIVVKQDRLLLEGGIGWWKQLQDAIDSVEFLVLVMTPSAIQSAMVREEWIYARQQGVCVYPVKAARDSELRFSQLPRWMGATHFFDIEKEWETFLAHIRKGCDTPRVPFMAPALPETLIRRSYELDQIKNLLLSSDPNEPITLTAALSGAGGFGKTTLAIELCHDEEIIQNFHDGILWVTLGQNPNILSSLATVYAALTGDRPGFASEEDAAFQLSQKLGDRACLFVIDDVWDDTHLLPFLRGRKRCSCLVTTSNSEIASSNARLVNVDEMSDAESLALLTSGISGLDPSATVDLSRRLGNWPIALELSRAMMRQRIDYGDSPQGALGWLMRTLTLKGPMGLAKGTGELRHRTISGVLETSVEILSTDNRNDRQRITELSIFPEDLSIPISAAAALWGLDELEAEETARRAARLHLLKLDLGQGTLRLHDVVRQWLRTFVHNVAECHKRLTEAWPDWMHLPDKYAWYWLTWHLAGAGSASDLENILWNPAWLQAKLAATDVNALISDFDQLNPKGEAALIQEAIQLSAHVLAKDSLQFVPQMVGRLLPHYKYVSIRRFHERLRQPTNRVWLRPVRPALDPPGTGLLRTLVGHSGLVAAALITSDDRIVSAAHDKTLKIWSWKTSGTS